MSALTTEQERAGSAELPGLLLTGQRSHFHPAIPNLQVYWDSSSLRPLMQCPRRYQRGVLQGWRPRATGAVDAEFGRIAGEGMELFFKQIIEEGATHDEAVRAALSHVLVASWDREAETPRFGSYEKVWHCLGTSKFKNEKGNAAKCPFSHKGKLFPAPGPETCGKCGSETESTSVWVPINPVKDRAQLARLIVWFAEEVKEGHFKPVGYYGGDLKKPKALVEVPWSLPFVTIDGVQLHLCGWFDGVKSFADPGVDVLKDEVFITDYKTTKHTLGPGYFAQYSPDIQVDLYDFAAEHVLPSTLPYQGVVIEAIQCVTDGVRFGLRVFRKTPEQRAEFGKELMLWLTMAVQYAKMGFWPRNRAACFLCPFKAVCSAPEGPEQEAILERDFVRKPWNPMTRTAEAAPVRRLATLAEAVARAKLRTAEAAGVAKEGA